MSEFDQRWQRAAAQAREAFEDAGPELHFGLASRVLARWREAPDEAWDDLFGIFGRRALMAAACALAVAAAFSIWPMIETGLARPELEQAVSADIWPQ